MFKTRLELKQAKTINPLKAKAKSWKMYGIDLGELNLKTCMKLIGRIKFAANSSEPSCSYRMICLIYNSTSIICQVYLAVFIECYVWYTTVQV